MYKNAGEFAASHPSFFRTGVDSSKHFFAVLAFSQRGDNQGNVRVFRYHRSFPKKGEKRARRYFAEREKLGLYGYLLLLCADKAAVRVLEEVGNVALLAKWMETRKGANKRANALTSSSYGSGDGWPEKSTL